MEDIKKEYGSMLDADNFEYLGWRYTNEGKTIGMLFHKKNADYYLTIKTDMYNNLVEYAKNGLKPTIRHMFTMLQGTVHVESYQLMLDNFKGLPVCMFSAENKTFIDFCQRSLDQMGRTLIAKNNLEVATYLEKSQEVTSTTQIKTAQARNK